MKTKNLWGINNRTQADAILERLQAENNPDEVYSISLNRILCFV